MNKILKILSVSLVGVISLLAITVHANPSSFPVSSKSASATTTLAYQTPGTATTTIQLDAYAVTRNFAVDGATLLLSQIASTSASIVNVSFQYSQDGIDWYGDNVNFGLSATTTSTANITNALSYTLGGNSLASTTRRAIYVETPVRFVRAVIVSTTGNNGIWAELQPKREVNE